MFTILGASGFIGSNLQKELLKRNEEVFIPPKQSSEIFKRPLGTVFYCVGLTADFRTRLLETIDAHVCYLMEILKNAQFEKLVYLSSTRVYQNADSTHENSVLKANPNNMSDLYNLSKLMGESACLATSNPQIKIARLSNVYGNDLNSENFLTSLLKDAKEKKHITLQTTLDSEKDYIHIDDVTKLLIQIAANGKERLYNVAAGENISNQALLNLLNKKYDFKFEVSANAQKIAFPRIDTSKIQNEFKFRPAEMTFG